MAGDFGKFVGRVATEWLGNGRDMKLLEPFAYVDRRGKTWNAPKNSVINGASIPASLWSIVGGPYEGQYRNASVIHDVACEEMKEPSDAVHQMFYEACRCGGVAERKAKEMYYAVYWFGPTWNVGGTRSLTSSTRAFAAGPSRDLSPVAVAPSIDELRTAMNYISEKNPTLKQIQKMKL